ncbi:ABC transporter ATP-binding protein [Leucobacter sp. wl10]|uniref:ABC transporter ATP-binding protein n=1 Tax=Leucobacter sp. wl10 TaxID=2304677 RepID=UPI000E5AEC19|nr:ABC transporter ATP-binding protein [Leucobacter sp. wl10]RGE20049.1 ABC transporter ATP-binding protein [Leucobacter sp. wl10]
MAGRSLVRIRDLSVEYAASRAVGAGRSVFRAVDGVHLDVPAGSVTSLVGESGSGKTSLGRAVMRLQPSASGTIEFDDADVTHARGRELAAYRRRAQIVFQDPYSSLDPRRTVAETVGEPLAIHRIGTRGADRERRVRRYMDLCGLDGRFFDRKPHELSGGQRQRVGIARALAVGPSFVVCDEPVSALDASVQAQILNLLMDLREEMGLTYLFIAHNLGVIRHISDHVAIMYLGRIVESGPRDEVFSNPKHPYTRALISSAPLPDPVKERAAKRERIVLKGDMPNAANPPEGCRFHTRCWLYQALGEPERCRTVPTESRELGNGHLSDCHYAAEDPRLGRPMSFATASRHAGTGTERGNGP